MKLVLTTNDGEVVNVWENIESEFLSTEKHHTLQPYYILDEIRSQIMRAKKAKIARFGVVTVEDEEDEESVGQTYEVVRELKD